MTEWHEKHIEWTEIGTERRILGIYTQQKTSSAPEFFTFIGIAIVLYAVQSRLPSMQ